MRLFRIQNNLTSTYLEGTENELGAFGFNRDGKKGKKQINIALLTDSEGFPLKIEVFEGDIQDHQTVLAQINSIKKEFDAKEIIFVGDRGMKIRYNLEAMDEADKEGIQYITGLTHPEIRELLKNDIIVELNLGRNVDTLKITELNKLQKEILKLFDMNKTLTPLH